MNQRAEFELIQKAKVFDENALAAIYDLYQASIYRYAYRLLGNEQAAEDCVADTFDRYLTALRSGGGPESFLQAYLFRIAHNWVTDQYRRKGDQHAVELDEFQAAADDPEDDAQRQMEAKNIRQAVNKLPVDQQQVITLRFLEGWEIDEVAITMKKTSGAIKALQHRGLASLQKLLIQDGSV